MMRQGARQVRNDVTDVFHTGAFNPINQLGKKTQKGAKAIFGENIPTNLTPTEQVDVLNESVD